MPTVPGHAAASADGAPTAPQAAEDDDIVDDSDFEDDGPTPRPIASTERILPAKGIVQCSEAFWRGFFRRVQRDQELRGVFATAISHLLLVRSLVPILTGEPAH